MTQKTEVSREQPAVSPQRTAGRLLTAATAFRVLSCVSWFKHSPSFLDSPAAIFFRDIPCIPWFNTSSPDSPSVKSMVIPSPACRARSHAFTLIELMAVVVVIVLLAAISFGVIGYVKRHMAVSTAKAQVAAMEAALESYKSDWGYYPSTGPGRISFNQACEGSNNLVLYRSLSGLATGGKRYMTFPTSAIRTNMHLPTTVSQTQQLGIFDPWGKLYNYYKSPATPYENVKTNAYAGYTLGGQVNTSTYDLFSYGPDGGTFIPGNPPYAYDHPWYGWYISSALWGNTNSANDDITNWKQ